MIVRRIRLGEWNTFREIRLASLKDSPDSFATTYESALERTKQSWMDQAESSAEGADSATFLVFDDESPVGVAALYRDENAMDSGELVQVWVAPEYRGTGTAKELIHSILTWAEEVGITRITTEVQESNNKVLRFYERLNFKAVHLAPSHPGSEVVLEFFHATKQKGDGGIKS